MKIDSIIHFLINKFFVFIIFICSFSSNADSQILMNTLGKLNLNPGGVIYDIAEDPYNDILIVVGKFSEINSEPVNNVAFLSKTDFSLISDVQYSNMIFQIDGEIRTVAFKLKSYAVQDLVTGLFYFVKDSYLYFGGNFTTVNNASHNGIVKFKRQESGPTPYDYTMQSWDPQIDWVGNAWGVNDLLFTNDTLIMAGLFDFTNGTPQENASVSTVCAFNVTNDSWASNMFNSIEFDYADNVFQITKYNDHYYLGGYSFNSNLNLFARFSKFDLLGNLVPSGDFIPYENNNCWDFEFVESLTDTLIVWTYDPPISASSIDAVGHMDGTENQNYLPTADPNYTPYLIDNTVENNRFIDIEAYKSKLYTVQTTGTFDYLNVFDVNDIRPLNREKSITLNANFLNLSNSGVYINDPAWVNGYDQTIIINNMLFLTGDNLTTVDGVNRTGLAAFCLEPDDAKYFTASDSTVCSGEVHTYTIPPVDYADGYLWEYTGTGVDLGANLFIEDLTNTITTANGGNTIQIAYLANFSPGQLKVTPYSTCGDNTIGTQKVFSNTIITNIESNPLPNVDAGLDSTFTCTRETIVLIGSSSSGNVISYEWVAPFGSASNTIGTDSTININDPLFSANSNEYYFKVVNDQGCANYDTVVITKNITPPNNTLPPLPWVVTCANPSIDLTGSSTTNNVSYSWSDGSNTINNQTVSVTGYGPWNLTVTDNINGCTTTDGYIVETDYVLPNITIVGYPSITLPLATLDCNTPNLNLVCSSDTANTSANWVAADSTNPIGDTKLIAQQGQYYIEVLNNSNGCKSYTSLFIEENFTEPTVNMPTLNTINCSRDTLVLNGSTISLDSTLVWNGPTYTNETNPLTTNQYGWHYFTVTKADNGCSKTDSINVVYEPTIDVFASEDTLVCFDTNINLNTTYSGNLTNVNYSWNNGTSTQSSTYNSKTSNYASVIVTADLAVLDTIQFKLIRQILQMQHFKVLHLVMVERQEKSL